MKSMKLFALIAFALSITPAFAAIELIPLQCGVTHAKHETNPIPDAPYYSLQCEARSAISGSGISCELTVHSLYPVGRQTQVALTQVSSTRNYVEFQGQGVMVHFNKRNNTAEIDAGYGEAECSRASN